MTYDFLQSFTNAHLNHDLDGDPVEVFDHWITHGYVFKSPDYLLIGGEDPDQPSPYRWFVYWAELRPDLRHSPLYGVAQFLRLIPYHRPFIAFNRGIRGSHNRRIYSTNAIKRLIKSSWPEANPR